MMDFQNRMSIKNSSQAINVTDKALGFNLETFLNTVAKLMHLIKTRESVQIGQLLSFG